MAINADHYAIVIGIRGYSQLRPLKGAESDAVEFGRWVTSEEGGGVPLENYAIILSPPSSSSNNPFEARPIQWEIDAALTRFGIEQKPRIGTRLYFYFSGHGFGPKFNEVGMLLANASINRLNSSLGLQPYREFFRKMEAFDEVIFILDCCRDPHAAKTLEPSFSIPDRGDGKKMQDLVVLGAPYGEQAFQPLDPKFKGTGERRGLLTKAIIEGLTLPEAADGLGRFTSSSLAHYVRERVKILAKDAGVEQVPNIDDTQLRENIVFSTIPDSKLERIKVSIVAPAGLGGELQLLDGFGNELARHPAAGAAAPGGWPVTLVRNRWYEVKLLPPKPGAKPNIIDLTEFTGDTHVYQFKP